MRVRIGILLVLRSLAMMNAACGADATNMKYRKHVFCASFQFLAKLNSNLVAFLPHFIHATNTPSVRPNQHANLVADLERGAINEPSDKKEGISQKEVAQDCSQHES